jgi:hypothetical protein
VFHPETEALLKAAGWTGRPSEDVSNRLDSLASEGFSMVPGLGNVLAEFSGVSVESGGSGREVGRARVEFDETHASGETDRFERFERVLGVALSPLGLVEGGMSFLALGSDGALYCFFHELWRAGATLEEGLDNLLLGRRMEQLEVPDEDW